MANPGFGNYSKKSCQKGRWVTADFHIHSIYSDGGFTPARILKYAAAHFLDVVAIADHSEVKGALEGKRLAEKDPNLPLTLTAQEVSAGNRFHFLLINSNLPYSDFSRDNILDNLAEHRRLGGVTVVAHPWTIPDTRWAHNCLHDLLAAGLVDGLELFNSAALEIPEIGKVWQRIWDEWIGPYKLGVFGGSDFHHLHKGRYIGTGRTYLKVNSPGERGVIEALRAKRCVAGLFGDKDREGFTGSGLLWGQEPWVNELEGLRATLGKRLAGLSHYGPAYRKLFFTLYNAGHYQFLTDLM